jgi:hypothetical protein
MSFDQQSTVILPSASSASFVVLCCMHRAVRFRMRVRSGMAQRLQPQLETEGIRTRQIVLDQTGFAEASEDNRMNTERNER